MIDFIFVVAGKRYNVRASDFQAATGYMNSVRDGWCPDLRWVSNGELNTFVLGLEDSKI